MKRIAGGVAVLALLLVGCASNRPSPAVVSSTEPATFIMTGTVTLSGGAEHFVNSAEGCVGLRGYSDIAAGTSVTVYGADGKIVGVGRLEPGVMADGGRDCLLPWTATDIPEGSGPYQYEVSHRGKLTVSEAEAHQALSASIGT